jgi:Tfp pilus assembly protein PilN
MLSNFRLVNSLVYARKLLCIEAIASLFTAALLLGIIFSIDTRASIAQIQEIPSLPSQEDDTSIDIESQPDNPTPTANTSNIPPPTIEITSLEDDQEVPVGELTIEGISSDNAESDCQVYADLNDLTPMQNATAAANAAEDNDFSKWAFTYSQDYQSIKEGANELTAKISCFNGENPVPISKWHSVNITGVATGSTTTTEGSTESISPPTTDDPATTTEAEIAPDTVGKENKSIEDLSPGVPPSG